MVASSPPQASVSTAPSLPSWQAGLVIAMAALLWLTHAFAPTVSIVLALGLFLLGVPHGAVERHTSRRGDLVRQLPTLGYTVLYLVVALVIFCSWILGPVQTLALFLVVSAVHFGQSEPHVRSAGLWVVLGSMVAFADPTLDIFGLLTNQSLAAIPRGLALAFGVAAAGLLLIEGTLRRAVPYAVFLIGLFLVLPPVQAVALYYFGVHSVREWRYVHAERGGVAAAARFYAPFSLPVLIGGAAVMLAVTRGWLDLPLATGLAIAIATPHMFPFERWVADSRDPSRNTPPAAH